MQSNISLTEEEKEVIRKIKNDDIFNCIHMNCAYCPFNIPNIELPVLPNGKITHCLVAAFSERGEKLL